MAKPYKSSLYDYGNESLPFRTKSSGLYRHREDLGLHKVGYKERNLHIRRQACLPRQGESHPDTGAVFGLRIFTAHQFGPWLTGQTPEEPLVQDSLISPLHVSKQIIF